MTNPSFPPLFRPAAVEAQSDQRLGRPDCTLPLRTTLLVYLFSLLIALAIAWLYWGSYTRRVTVAGQIQPGDQVLRLYPGQAGIVEARHVEQGETVRAGQALFTLSAERQSALGPTQQRIAEALAARLQSLAASIAAMQQLGAMQRADLQRRLRLLTGEIARAEQEAHLLARKRALAQQAWQRFNQLAAEGFISPAQLQQKEEERLEAQRAWLAQTRALDGLRREQAGIAAELGEQPLRQQDQQETLRRTTEALRQETAQHQAGHRWQVTAPRAGTLAAVTASAGAPAAVQQPLALLVPADARLEAHLYAPSKAVGFIRPGTAVKLRLDAFPYQKFGHISGRVVSVARSALLPQEIDLPTDARESLYRIRVQLDRADIQAYGRAMPLMPAMRLEADLLLDRRRLYEWVLEPLYSVSGKW